MVEPLDALVAVGTMKTARCSNQATLGAHLCRVHRSQNRHEVHSRVRLEETWVFEPNNDPQEYTDDIKGLTGVEDPILGTLTNLRFVVLAQDRICREL